MTDQMKPGDAVLVRATYEDYQDDGTWAWVTIEEDRDMPGGDALVRRSRLTTEAAIRASALDDVAEELEAHSAKYDANYGGTYCTECGAPQAVPWEHDGCAVALVRARAASLRGAT